MKLPEPTHQLKNAKGLFVESHTWGILSVAVAQHLREHALPLMDKQGKAPLADYVKTLDLVQGLPTLVAHMEVEFPDALYDAKAHKAYLAQKAKKDYSYNCRQSEWMLCHGWKTIGSAKGASSHATATSCSSPKESGWLDIAEVAKRAGLIDDMLKAVGIEPIGEDPRFTGAATVAKRSKDIVFEKIEPTNQYAETESFLLFVAGRGYLDDKGSTGPLSRARGFESAAAAARTAGSRKLSSWKIVKSQVSVTETVEFKGDSPSVEMSSAVAYAEAKAMARALDSASIEKLRERLAELEAKEGGPAKPAPRKSSL
jgi:hypothetical protein